MSCFTCNRGPFRSSFHSSFRSIAIGSSFAALSRAAAKSAAARLRGLGALATSPHWAARAAACERCPLLFVRAGVSYCGKPFLQQVDRGPGEGCGCPTRDKARDPDEHCPLDERNRPAARDTGGDGDGKGCNCKWCAAAR